MGIGSLASAAAGWLVGWHTRRRDYLAASERRTEISEQRGRDDRRENANEIDAITKRFAALISGYEKRVVDLTNEVHEMRAEVIRLRAFIDQHFALFHDSPQAQDAKTDTASSTSAPAA